MKNIRKLLEIDKLHEEGINGQGVGVAILDTGVFKHKDFVWKNDRLVCFKDFVGNGKIAYDDNGHGTHVAGICGASGEASLGVYKGIAPKCNIIALKVLNQYGIGSVDSVENAISWVIENRYLYNIQVVNLSVGTYGIDKSDTNRLTKCVENAWNHGMVVCTAAGNKGPKPYTITQPGTSRKIITVGASEMCVYYSRGKKGKKDYSGCGPTREYIVKPEVVAPGCNIVSCAGTGDIYISKSGTSMATPVVSGVAALIWQYLYQRGQVYLENERNRKWDTYDMKNRKHFNKELKKALFETSLDMGRDRNSQGWGLVNPKGIIEYMEQLI